MRCAIAFLVFFLPVLSWLFRSDLCVVRSADNESSDHFVFFTSIRSPSKVKAVAHSSSSASAFCYSVGPAPSNPVSLSETSAASTSSEHFPFDRRQCASHGER
ncbi:hypothetical protein VD0001_g9023 [Verticillium dahliae]|nr:hypothetical protein VD0001_g9023 [Verticillium dahliae]